MPAITHDLRKTLEGIEVKIYELLCSNLSNEEISTEIKMPVSTVKWHLKNIYRHLGIEALTPGESHQVRRKAILYGGTRVEQVVSYTREGEKGYSVKEIRTACKRVGLSRENVENLVSFLEIEG